MDVKTFGSDEEMREFIAANNKAAMEGLHPVQRAIDLGTCWVQFYDLDAHPPFIIFGRVATEAEILSDAGDCGEDTTEAIARERARLAETGLMYGWAASQPFPEGEWGYTHQASVWPIGETLFAAARAVQWNINRLDSAGRMLLEVAYQGIRTHSLEKIAGDPHDPKPVTRDEVAAVLANYWPEAGGQAALLAHREAQAMAVAEIMALIKRA